MDILPPETATFQRKHKKRGRKGNKIITALYNAPTVPMPIEQYSIEQGVSINALRQHKRFYSQLPIEEQQDIGTIHIKQDRDTKVLMIWKDITNKSSSI